MDYISLFAWSFGVAIGPVISPGPVSTAIVTESIRRGFRAGPLVATGHALMELIMIGALALGMGHVLQRPALAATIGTLGGIFLLWMGGMMTWGAARRRARLPQVDESTPQVDRSLVGLGIATTLGNPFWYAWWIGVGGGYVLMTHQRGLIALATFYVGHVLADYLWDTLLASVVNSGRRWLTDGIYQALLGACGLFLVYTGVRFVSTGIGFVIG